MSGLRVDRTRGVLGGGGGLPESYIMFLSDFCRFLLCSRGGGAGEEVGTRERGM
jgi:hypothetical protein